MHPVMPLYRGRQGRREGWRELPTLWSRHVRPSRRHHLRRHRQRQGEGAEGYPRVVRQGLPNYLVLRSLRAVPGGFGG